MGASNRLEGILVTRALGLMSGTLPTGIDVAIIETDGAAEVTQGPARSFSYSDEDRALLRAALAAAQALPADPATREARPGILAEAERRVTARHAEAVRDFLIAEMIDPASVDIVGFHGQTVIHRPAERFTVQIGDGAQLALAVGRPVAYDFRAADVAAGGQGAPLVPIYHRALVEAAGFVEPSLSSTSAASPILPMSMAARRLPLTPGRAMRDRRHDVFARRREDGQRRRHRAAGKVIPPRWPNCWRILISLRAAEIARPQCVFERRRRRAAA